VRLPNAAGADPCLALLSHASGCGCRPTLGFVGIQPAWRVTGTNCGEGSSSLDGSAILESYRAKKRKPSVTPDRSADCTFYPSGRTALNRACVVK
jgi:hypothetical protein